MIRSRELRTTPSLLLRLAALPLLVAFVLSSGDIEPQEDWEDLLPPKPPAQIVDPEVDKFVRARCSVCHSFEWVSSKAKTREGWAETLERVRSYGVEDIWGTQIGEDFKERILKYLEGNFGPPKKATAAYELLTDPLLKEKCTQCHGLELIAANRKTPEGWNFTLQQMRQYAHLFRNRDQMRQALRETLDRMGREDAPDDFVIDRKVQSHDIQLITPEEAEYMARYLSKVLPLLPGEFAANEKKTFDVDGERACMSCHGMGTIRQQVKIPEAWERTVGRMAANHAQQMPGFRREGFPEGFSGVWEYGTDRGDIPENQEWEHIRDKVIQSLKDNFAYDTEEWRQWLAEGSRKDNLLEGTWDIFGKDTEGSYEGTIRFGHVPESHNQYAVTRSIQQKGSEETITWHGEADLFGGRSLRTHYSLESSGPGFVQILGQAFFHEQVEESRVIKIRGQHTLSEDREQFQGVLRAEGHPTRIGEETYVRRGNQMLVLRCEPSAVQKEEELLELGIDERRGYRTVEVVIHGRWLPTLSFWSFSFDWFGEFAQGPAATVTFSDPSLRVRSVERSTDGGRTIRVRLQVFPEAELGWNDVTVRDNWGMREATGKRLLLVYDNIHSVRIEPPLTVARLGEAPIHPRVTHEEDYPSSRARVIPKVPVHLRAIAYSNGPDGKPGTADDIRIEEVPVEWSFQAVDFHSTRWKTPDASSIPDSPTEPQWVTEYRRTHIAQNPYSPETRIELGASPSGDPLRDRLMSQAKEVEIPGVGKFVYVPNVEKQPFGNLSPSGIFTPSVESPQVELDEQRNPVSSTARTSSGDYRGTALITASYDPGRGAAPVVGYGVVVVSPPDWTPTIPWEDDSSSYYHAGR